MKNNSKMFRVIAFLTIIGFSMVTCDDPADEMPALTGIVNITGIAQVGQTLTANTNISGTGVITYQWKRETINIGTNSNTYIVQAADAGSTITVTVTRTGNSGSVTSNPTGTIIDPLTHGTLGLAFELIKGNTEYSVSLGTARALGEVIIPTIYNGLPVTVIANNAFSSAVNMTDIVIPGGITNIGSSAFSGCEGLTSVRIPGSVTNIDSNAFHGCISLTRVTFMGIITSFSYTSPFPGDLRTKYQANDGGIGTYSRTIGSNTWTGAPGGLTVSEATTTSVTIRWNSISAADGYKIYRSASADITFTEVGTSETITYTDTGLTEGTRYFYRVAAAYNDEASPQSNAINTTTVPGIPTGVSAITTSFSSITISWSSVTGATGYRIYSNTSSTGTFTEVGTSTTTSFTNSGLTASTTYYYKVAAYSSGGTGEQSSTVNTATASGIPTGVSATAASFSSITVSWNSVTGATGYRIYRSTSSTGTFTQIGTSTSTSYTNTGLDNSTTYYYKVTAYNNSGTGEQSSAVSATTLTFTPIQLTANVWINGTISASASEIWYSFPVTNATTYRVWWNDAYGSNGTKTGDIAVSARYSGSSSWIFGGTNTSVDSGWSTAQSFTANQTGTVQIRVIPYDRSGSYYGTYGIVYSTGTTRPAL